MLTLTPICIVSRLLDEDITHSFSPLSITKTMKTSSLFPYKQVLAVFAITIGHCLVSCTTTQSIRGVSLSNGNEKTFNKEMAIVLPALRQALTEEKATITLDSTLDEKTQMIIGETPVSGFSWGEVIRIISVKRGEDKTTLRVLTERKLATNILANGDYSTNLFFKVAQKLPK